jgi:peptide alpha-N-acetyltransferase
MPNNNILTKDLLKVSNNFSSGVILNKDPSTNCNGSAKDCCNGLSSNHDDEVETADTSKAADSAATTPTPDMVTDVTDMLADQVLYVVYESELQMPDIMRLIQKDLSEPYSIYTYRYFIHNWPHLCFMVRNTLVALNWGRCYIRFLNYFR